jgi:hypothetical protein
VRTLLVIVLPFITPPFSGLCYPNLLNHKW